MITLGIDTSNYTTSVAVFDNRKVVHSRKLLPVKDNAVGLRQSDAVFLHTKQFSEVLDGIELPKSIDGIGVSDRPSSIEGSYMPCFLVGKTIAETLAKVYGVKVKYFTHQQGHIAAGLYSSGKLDLFERDFLALHLSGGTTDLLLVEKSEGNPRITLIGGSSDLKAGQAVDRVGNILGLGFPAGKELESLALNSRAQFKIKPPVKELTLSLSGVENKCKKMMDDDFLPEDIALYCLKYISASICQLTNNAMQKFPDLPMLFVGGVMSDSIIRNDLSFYKNAVFAQPEFSSDNACGAAVLAALY
jgi:N6-L-threonylcarbamoyladenine synthase